ncbi:hypothetical protein MNBD_GAMMA11-2835 [hydrothermal vent metagenome]|uniref:Uncharacterized protein n=1 Tax=hydrothermal vent metagenome TaxID=652676 RepID=A0A3B0X1C7_9ZZZZ
MSVLQEQKPTPEAPRTLIFCIRLSGNAFINRAQQKSGVRSCNQAKQANTVDHHTIIIYLPNYRYKQEQGL